MAAPFISIPYFKIDHQAGNIVVEVESLIEHEQIKYAIRDQMLAIDVSTILRIVTETSRADDFYKIDLFFYKSKPLTLIFDNEPTRNAFFDKLESLRGMSYIFTANSKEIEE